MATSARRRKKSKKGRKKRRKKSGKPLISVIVPFRDNVEDVKDCIKSLKKQKYDNIEIVLVSDKVKWEEDKMIKSVHDPSFQGVGEKRNAGVKKAKGDIFFFLDSDCTVRKDALVNIVKIFENTEASAISGKTLAPEKESNLLGIATGLEYEDRFDRMGEGYVTVAATTCLSVKRKAFENIGGFEDYSLKEATGEDWDFSRKFTKAGFKLYHSNTVEVHHNHHADSLKKWFKRRVQHSGYRIAHKRRHDQVFEEYFSLRMFVETSLLLSIPVALRLYKKRGMWEVFALPLFSILRNVAWFTGIARELAFR